MRNVFCHIILILVLALATVENAFAQETKLPPPSSFLELSAELSTTKTSFLPLEPIPIFFSTTNITAQPALMYSSFSFNTAIKLFVTHKGITQNIETVVTITSCGEVTPKVIEPGKNRQISALLTLELSKYFPEPGKYEIQATLSDATEKYKIKSNIVSIEILQPTGQNLQAMQYIQNKDSRFFFTGMTANPEALETFASEFNTTPYGNYAVFLVGKNYLNQGNKEGYEKSIKLLEKLANQNDFFFADKTLSCLVEAYAKLGFIEKAKSYFQALGRLYPNSEFVERSQEIILKAGTIEK